MTTSVGFLLKFLRRCAAPAMSVAAATCQENRLANCVPRSETKGPAGAGPSSVGLRVAHGACVTALSAFTCPCPYQELYPAPPAQVCGAPFETDVNGL